MAWPRALLLLCFVSSVLCACHEGMRARADASGGAGDLGVVAPSEDAPSAGPARDTQTPDETVLADAAAPDARIPDTLIGDSASGDGGPALEVARIVREGTNFGTVTVTVYSDASAVRIWEESMKIRTFIDAAPERTIETLPPALPRWSNSCKTSPWWATCLLWVVGMVHAPANRCPSRLTFT